MYLIPHRLSSIEVYFGIRSCAILSGQGLILLGERGQAKTRLARSLVDLLDEQVPAIEGCEINDDPYHPICQQCRSRVQGQGKET